MSRTRPYSPSTVECATVFGHWEVVTGKSRLNVVPAPHGRYASGNVGTTIAEATMSDGLTAPSGRMRTIIIWIVTVLLFLIFGGAGLANVMGAEPMVQSFASYGLPTQFVVRQSSNWWRRPSKGCQNGKSQFKGTRAG